MRRRVLILFKSYSVADSDLETYDGKEPILALPYPPPAENRPDKIPAKTSCAG